MYLCKKIKRSPLRPVVGIKNNSIERVTRWPFTKVAKRIDPSKIWPPWCVASFPNVPKTFKITSELKTIFQKRPQGDPLQKLLKEIENNLIEWSLGDCLQI